MPAFAGATAPAPATDVAADEPDAVTANATPESQAAGRGTAAAMPPASGDEDGPPPFDEAAESAFLAEAHERGESVTPPAAAVKADAEEEGGNALPKLDELVNRIPPEIRDVLDELFRARFVAVKRFPKKALKG